MFNRDLVISSLGNEVKVWENFLNIKFVENIFLNFQENMIFLSKLVSTNLIPYLSETNSIFFRLFFIQCMEIILSLWLSCELVERFSCLQVERLLL